MIQIAGPDASRRVGSVIVHDVVLTYSHYRSRWHMGASQMLTPCDELSDRYSVRCEKTSTFHYLYRKIDKSGQMLFQGQNGDLHAFV